MRVIAEIQPSSGLWIAEVDGDGGSRIVHEFHSVAVHQLCENEGIDHSLLSLDQSASTTNRLVYLYESYVATESTSTMCPDCHGSRMYVGLSVIEECGTCQGMGHIALAPTDSLG